MTRALLLVSCALSLLAAACDNVQDLGATPPREERPNGPAATTSSSALTAVKPPPPVDIGPCPYSAPVDGASCSVDTGWCSYRVDPAAGLAATCACGVDRRWTCLLVRDDDRRNPLPASEMPITTASCTEGAPCVEGLKCMLSGPSPRTCSCTSAGILLCTRPAQ